MFGAELFDRSKPRADLDALHRVDAHHHLGDVRVQAPVQRLAPPRGNAGSDHVQPRAHALARLAKLVHVGLELGDARRIGHEERIALRAHVVPGFELDAIGTELRKISAHLDAVFLAQPLLRDRTRRNGRRSQTSGSTTAAAWIANAVLLEVRVVGVPGAERLRDLVVILRALVHVLDQERDRRARRAPLVHARENLQQVILAPLRNVPRRAGLASVEVGLDVLLRELHPRWAAVDHAADRGPVRFAERGDSEEGAESVAGHGDEVYCIRSSRRPKDALTICVSLLYSKAWQRRPSRARDRSPFRGKCGRRWGSGRAIASSSLPRKKASTRSSRRHAMSGT